MEGLCDNLCHITIIIFHIFFNIDFNRCRKESMILYQNFVMTVICKGMLSAKLKNSDSKNSKQY